MHPTLCANPPNHVSLPSRLGLLFTLKPKLHRIHNILIGRKFILPGNLPVDNTPLISTLVQ